MNEKKEKNYELLVYDENTDIWEVKKADMWYHEAMTMQDEYTKRNITSKVVDNKHLEEFIKYANGRIED